MSLLNKNVNYLLFIFINSQLLLQIKNCIIYTSSGSSYNSKSTLKIIRENWGMAYSACFILCHPLVPVSKRSELITHVGIQFENGKSSPTLLNVESYFNKTWEGDFSVCVKPFHYEFNRAVWLVEFIELNQMMGVSKFFFYNHTVGKDVEHVLQKYIKEGVVEIFKWTLPVKSQKVRF